MQRIAFALVALGAISVTGCGCLENLTESTLYVHPGRGTPDPKQPGWQQCLFGTKRVPPGPGDRFYEKMEADPNQSSWNRFLYGTRYIPLSAESETEIRRLWKGDVGPRVPIPGSL